MTRLNFDNFSFFIEENQVKIDFGKHYFFKINLQDLKDIDNEIIISEKYLEFPNLTEKSANNKINKIIDNGLHNLTNSFTNKKVLFIDEYSNIPLIGSGEFGIIDRNTNIIEIKPVTGCNLDCIYCSVNAGDKKKTIDILIDPYYLIQESKKVAIQKTHDVEFNINPHGEPLLYPFMEELISGLKEFSKVISINTNGTFLNKEKINALIEAGLTRINLSLNTLDQEIASKMSGKAYPLKHVLQMIKYAQEKGLAVLIAPVIVPTFNDSNERDIEPLIQLSQKLKSNFPKIGFQKFLNYKGGKNPVNEIPFEDFFENLRIFEDKYNLVLTPKKDYNPFLIYEDKTLEKPFTKNQTVKVDIICPSRNIGETLCKASNRIVTVRGLKKDKGSINVKIVRDKHNIFIGVPLNLF